MLPVSTISFCLIAHSLVGAWRFGAKSPVRPTDDTGPLLKLSTGTQHWLESTGKAIEHLAKSDRPSNGKTILIIVAVTAIFVLLLVLVAAMGLFIFFRLTGK
jgi:hypothetical protein